MNPKVFQTLLVLLFAKASMLSVSLIHNGNQVACTYFNATYNDLVAFYVVERNAIKPCDVIGLDERCRNELIEARVLETTSTHPCKLIANNDTVACQFDMSYIEEICCYLNNQSCCFSILPMATPTTTGFFITLPTPDEGMNATDTTDNVTDLEAGTSNDGLVLAAVLPTVMGIIIVLVVMVGMVVIYRTCFKKKSCVNLGNGSSPNDSSQESVKSISQDEFTTIDESLNHSSIVAEESFTSRRNLLPRPSTTRSPNGSEPPVNNQLSSIHSFNAVEDTSYAGIGESIHLEDMKDAQLPIVPQIIAESKQQKNGESKAGMNELQDTDGLSGNKNLQCRSILGQPQAIESEEPNKVSVEETGRISDKNHHVFLPRPSKLAAVVINRAVVPYSPSTPPPPSPIPLRD